MEGEGDEIKSSRGSWNFSTLFYILFFWLQALVSEEFLPRWKCKLCKEIIFNNFLEAEMSLLYQITKNRMSNFGGHEMWGFHPTLAYEERSKERGSEKFVNLQRVS